MNLEALLPQATQIAVKIGGAILLWVVGRFVIKLLIKAVSSSLRRSHVDSTLAKWIEAIANLMANFLLAIAVLSVFGVETTSFAALLAAAGLAIGAAWAGLLANFAAGVFLILFKPFKVGDRVRVADVSGRVSEIGVFATTLITKENVATIIGNGAISTAIISNYSQTEFRVLEVTAQLQSSDNAMVLLQDLRKDLLGLADVLSEPAPTTDVVEINEFGPKINVCVACKSEQHDQIRHQINEMILTRLASAPV
jgi:small conductance mechanosensitive channel